MSSSTLDEHRARHPEQYNHPMCGKAVDVETHTGHKTSGTVERVVGSRFGPLVNLGNPTEWWSLADCTEQKEQPSAPQTSSPRGDREEESSPQAAS